MYKILHLFFVWGGELYNNYIGNTLENSKKIIKIGNVSKNINKVFSYIRQNGQFEIVIADNIVM